MTTRRIPLALVLAAAVLAGCTLSPARYASYDDWTVGDPEHDYGLLRDQAVRFRTLYAVALTPVYAAVDGLRLALVPVALGHHLLLGRIRAVRPREGESK